MEVFMGETLVRAIEKFGEKTQLLVCVEELSELQKELLKYANRGVKNKKEIIEEMADVYITLTEAMYILDIDDYELDDVVESKIKRLKKRLDEMKQLN